MTLALCYELTYQIMKLGMGSSTHLWEEVLQLSQVSLKEDTPFGYYDPVDPGEVQEIVENRCGI